MTNPESYDPYDQQIADLLEGNISIDKIGGLLPETNRLLREFQKSHVMSMLHILRTAPLRESTCVADITPCGYGKTPCGVAVVSELQVDNGNLGAIVVCPLSVLPKWREWACRMNVNVVLVNYETLKLGKVYGQTKTTTNKKKRVTSNFMIPIRNSNGDIVDFEWRVPKDMVIIFDEAHVCSNQNSLNGKLMLAARGKARILLLSATLAHNESHFAVFGYMLGCYSSISAGRSWIANYVKSKGGLFNALVPKYAASMILGKNDTMFESTIDVDTYGLPKKILNRIEELWSFCAKSNNMERQHKIKCIIEHYLSLAIEDKVKQCVKSGGSVIIYLNYRKSVAFMADLLKTTCIIEGGQDDEVRARNIRRFQEDKEHVIVCNTAAGGVGIDLDDRNGKRKRSLFLRPGNSAKNIKQALERPNRLTAKSKSHRFIMFVDTPFERLWRDRIASQIAFLDRLNDSSISPLALKLDAKLR
jgi:superfamily II DNA or RNA helicase